MTPHPPEARDFRTLSLEPLALEVPVLGLLLVIPAISYAFEARKQPQYRSSALVRPQSVAIDPSLFPARPSGEDGILTVARLVQTRTIAGAAGRLLDPPAPGSAVSGMIDVEPDIQTLLLTISATSPDPRHAADVANAFARAISANRAAQQIGQIDSAIGGLKRQLAELPQSSELATPDPQRNQLTDQIQKLRTLRRGLRPDQGIVELAIPSTTQLGRNPRRAIELGIVIALLLGAGVVALAESSDRRVRSADELEDLTGRPLLSAIPTSAFAGTDDDGLDDESFQMLRAALTYFNADRQLSSVVIASPGQEDGKTTVAIGLAFALARAGSRIILVDADLRQPRIGLRIGEPATGGLADVLVGTLELRDALVNVPVHPRGNSSIQRLGGLKFLPAGVSATNPAELLSSPELKGVLTALALHADLVVVDSAAALAVSDALPLLQAASGVVLVARLDRSTKAGVRRLQQVIEAANGTIVGVVATGAGKRGGYEYGYGYAPPARGSRHRNGSSEQMATPPRHSGETVP